MIDAIVIPTAHFKGHWRVLQKLILFYDEKGCRVQVGDNPEASRFFPITNPEGSAYRDGEPAIVSWLNEMADYFNAPRPRGR